MNSRAERAVDFVLLGTVLITSLYCSGLIVVMIDWQIYWGCVAPALTITALLLALFWRPKRFWYLLYCPILGLFYVCWKCVVDVVDTVQLTGTSAPLISNLSEGGQDMVIAVSTISFVLAAATLYARLSGPDASKCAECSALDG